MPASAAIRLASSHWRQTSGKNPCPPDSLLVKVRRPDSRRIRSPRRTPTRAASPRSAPTPKPGSAFPARGSRGSPSSFPRSSVQPRFPRPGGQQPEARHARDAGAQRIPRNLPGSVPDPAPTAPPPSPALPTKAKRRPNRPRSPTHQNAIHDASPFKIGAICQGAINGIALWVDPFTIPT